MTKTIDTLVSDIYGLFKSPHKVSDENLKELGEAVKECVKKKIEEAGVPREPTLRISVIGKPDRQLWFELNAKDPTKVAAAGDVDLLNPDPAKHIKFLLGDILEQLLVFFIKESGHTIQFRQEEVELKGVLGHTDGAIDRVVADMKSSSSLQFYSKFASKALLSRKPENDPFGYKGQLAGYYTKLTENHPDDIDPERAGWLVINKESGEILWLEIDPFNLIDAEARVEHLKKMVSQPEPPEERCYPEVPDGKSGNMALHKSCAYCPFKDKCWPDLKAYKYANGTKWLTKVVKEPRVEEV